MSSVLGTSFQKSQFFKVRQTNRTNCRRIACDYILGLTRRGNGCIVACTYNCTYKKDEVLMNKKMVSFRLSQMAQDELDRIVEIEGADSKTEMIEKMILLWLSMRNHESRIEALEAWKAEAETVA